MDVGILGTGDVGKALGKGFATLGRNVKMGSRDAKNEKALAWATDFGWGVGRVEGLSGAPVC